MTSVPEDFSPLHLKQAIEGIQIRPVGNVEIYGRTIPRFLGGDPAWRGRMGDSDKPVVYVRATKKNVRLARRTQPRLVLGWGWDELLGGVFSLVIAFGESPGETIRICLPSNEEPIANLRSGNFSVVLVFGTHAAVGFSIRTPDLESQKSLWGDHVDRLKNHRVDIVDIDASMRIARSRTYGDQSLVRHTVPQDLLLLGWAEELEHSVERFANACEECRHIYQSELHSRVEGDLLPVLHLGLSCNWEPSAIAHEARTNMAATPDAFVRNFFLVSEGKGSESEHEPKSDEVVALNENCYALMGCLRDFLLLSGPWSQRGRALPSLERGSMLSAKIRVSEFPQDYSPRNFWPSAMSLRVAGGLRVGSKFTQGVVPFPMDVAAESTSLLPTTDDWIGAEGLTKSLLREAAEGKQWVIPFGARVEMSIGPFSVLELYEYSHGDVDILLKDKNERGIVAYVEPRNGALFINLFPFYCDSAAEDGGYAASRTGTAAIELVLAALVRDFWVTEERRSILGVGVRPRSKADGQSSPGGAMQDPTIVYLPRVKYDRRLDAAQDRMGAMTGTEHAKHSVHGHLRRANSASQKQLFLARAHGLEVPEGYTFVRPHERGGSDRVIVYRSRSALQLLSASTKTTPEACEESDWFRFELRVKETMEHLGFLVEHVSASRSGDGGVDLYATKGEGVNAISWVVQAKCYASYRTVGVPVVRELVGALAEFPRGTRGMVVATTKFSRDAQALASKHNIYLVGGLELERTAGDHLRNHGP